MASAICRWTTRWCAPRSTCRGGPIWSGTSRCPRPRSARFDTELVREFFQAFSTHGGITLHVDQLHGINSHHIAEAAFKAVARALRDGGRDRSAQGRCDAVDQGRCSSSMLTVLIDYESGNLHSAEKAFQRMAREVDAGRGDRDRQARGRGPRRPDRAAGRRSVPGLSRGACAASRGFTTRWSRLSSRRGVPSWASASACS